MNIRTPAWVAAAAFAAGLSAPTAFQQNEPLEVRVTKLERELAEAKKENARVADLGSKVDAIEAYLQGFARAASDSAGNLDLAVEKGFTHGINPAASEAMVESVRNLSAAAREKVPGVPEPQPTGPDPRRSRFQRDG